MKSFKELDLSLADASEDLKKLVLDLKREVISLKAKQELQENELLHCNSKFRLVLCLQNLLLPLSKGSSFGLNFSLFVMIKKLYEYCTCMTDRVTVASFLLNFSTY